MSKRVSRRIHRQRRLTVYSDEPLAVAVKPPPSPFGDLPDELLAHIFQFVADDDFANDRSVVALCAATSLSRVCRRWRQVVGSYSTLWDRLQLHLTPLSNSHNIYAFPAWLKNSGCRSLELILDMRLDDTDLKVFDSWKPAYARMALRRLDVDVTRSLVPHITRLTRLDLHLHVTDDADLVSSKFWDALGDATHLRELTLSCNRYEYVTLPGDRRLPPSIVSLSLTRVGLTSGFGHLRSSLRRLEINNENMWGAPPSLQQVVSWIDVSELTELRLHRNALEVLLWPEQLGKPHLFSSLHTLHFYDFAAEELVSLLPLISTPKLNDFLVTGREPVLAFLKFLAENPTRTFPECTKLYLDADRDEVEPDHLEALAAAFPNLTELHVRDLLSDAVLQCLLPAEEEEEEDGDGDAVGPTWWPKLTDVSFEWNEGNTMFHDQLFNLIEARREAKRPLEKLGFVCPRSQSVDEGGLQLLKEFVAVSQLKA